MVSLSNHVAISLLKETLVAITGLPRFARNDN